MQNQLQKQQEMREEFHENKFKRKLFRWNFFNKN